MFGDVVVLAPQPGRIITAQFGFQRFETHVAFVLLVPGHDRGMVDILADPAAELRFGIFEVFAGRFVVVHEAPFVLNHDALLVGDVVPFAVGMAQMDAQVVEIVLLYGGTQEAAYPRFVEHHVRPAVERPDESDVFGPEKGLFAVDQYVAAAGFNAAVAETFGFARAKHACRIHSRNLHPVEPGRSLLAGAPCPEHIGRKHQFTLCAAARRYGDLRRGAAYGQHVVADGGLYRQPFVPRGSVHECRHAADAPFGHFGQDFQMVDRNRLPQAERHIVPDARRPRIAPPLGRILLGGSRRRIPASDAHDEFIGAVVVDGFRKVERAVRIGRMGIVADFAAVQEDLCVVFGPQAEQRPGIGGAVERKRAAVPDVVVSDFPVVDGIEVFAQGGRRHSDNARHGNLRRIGLRHRVGDGDLPLSVERNAGVGIAPILPFAVDRDLRQDDAGGIPDDHRFGGRRQGQPADGHVAYGHIGESPDVDACLPGPLCPDIPDHEPAERRGMVFPALRFVVRFEKNEGLAHAVGLHAADEDIFDITSAVEVRFEIDAVADVGHAHILDDYVAHAARNLAADADAVGLRSERAVADQDVFRGTTDTPCVVITARFDGDAVVARAEGTVFDQYVRAGLRVAAVVVEVVTVHRHATHRDVFARQWMNDPERGIHEGHALDQHVRTIDRFQHGGAQVMALTEQTVADRG